MQSGQGRETLARVTWGWGGAGRARRGPEGAGEGYVAYKRGLHVFVYRTRKAGVTAAVGAYAVICDCANPQSERKCGMRNCLKRKGTSAPRFSF